MKEEIKREIRKHFEPNNNESITYQTSWDIAKSMLTGQFVC